MLPKKVQKRLQLTSRGLVNSIIIAGLYTIIRMGALRMEVLAKKGEAMVAFGLRGKTPCKFP